MKEFSPLRIFTLLGKIYISSKYARDQNIINELFYATKINVLLDNGSVRSETCSSLVFL
jgi:hypothetical protein